MLHFTHDARSYRGIDEIPVSMCEDQSDNMVDGTTQPFRCSCSNLGTIAACHACILAKNMHHGGWDTVRSAIRRRCEGATGYIVGGSIKPILILSGGAFDMS
jgi:hypothetical protein